MTPDAAPEVGLTEADVRLGSLSELILEHYNSHPLDIARKVLTSDWLAEHDARIKADAIQQERASRD